MLKELESRIAQSSFVKSLIEKDNEKAIGIAGTKEFHSSMVQLQLLDNQLTILKCLKNIIGNSNSPVNDKEKDTPIIDPVIGDIILDDAWGICKVISLHTVNYFVVIDLWGRHLSFARKDFEFPVPDSYWKIQEFKFRDKATVFIYGVDVVIIGLGLSGKYRVVFSDGNFGSYPPEELRPVFPDKC